MLRIDFLYLDLTTCARCRAAERGLASALEAARDALAAARVEVEVNKIHVESAAEARELRLLTSPTIRVNGRDIALELRESSCGSEACTDGCGESIDCRVWVYRGREHTEPPVEMIVEAIERELDGWVALEPEPYVLPDNLGRFFAGKTVPVATQASECCSPADQAGCCEPADKPVCCGASSGSGCGCQGDRCG